VTTAVLALAITSLTLAPAASSALYAAGGTYQRYEAPASSLPASVSADPSADVHQATLNLGTKRTVGITLSPDVSAPRQTFLRGPAVDGDIFSAALAGGTTYNPTSVAMGVPGIEIDPAVKQQCLDSLAALSDSAGQQVACTDWRTATIHFSEPVSNPIVRWSNAGNALVGSTTGKVNDVTGCAAMSSAMRISAVNGTATRVGQVSAVPGEFYGNLNGNEISFAKAGRVACTTIAGAGSDVPSEFLGQTKVNNVQVSGLVSDLTIQWQDRVTALYEDDPNTTWLGGFHSPSSHVDGFLAYGFLGVAAPQVDLQMAKSGSVQVLAGGQVSWDLSVTNAVGSADSHGFVIHDAVPAGVEGARIAAGPDGCSLSGSDLVCSIAPTSWQIADPGADPPLLTGGADLSRVTSALAAGASFGPITLTGTTTAPAGSTITNTATVSGMDYDPDESNNSASASTTVIEPEWAVAKTATVASGAAYVSPGEKVDYAVTATNASTNDVTGVTLNDDLTDVLADADIVQGSVQLTVGGSNTVLSDPTVDSPLITAGPFTLPAGQDAVLSYQVVVHSDAWSAALDNTVSASGATPPGTCSEDADPSDVCSTHTVVTARLDLLKRGTVNGSVVALDGSAFEVLADAAGAPGDVLTALSVSPGAGTGMFSIEDVQPGTYWLRETKAPVGHELLAQAVRFTVDDTGVVTLSNPAADTQVTVEGGRLVVTDSPRFDLPTTGGSGTRALTLLGCLLLLAAAGTTAAAVIHRRRHLRGSAVPEEVSITG
jgi:fimbrial isopeptide formation D2 family protein/LPXTG-motif cell wall-anchored protein